MFPTHRSSTARNHPLPPLARNPRLLLVRKTLDSCPLPAICLRGVLATNTTLSSFPHHFPSDLKRIIRSIFCDYPLSRKIRRLTRSIFCDYPLFRKIRRLTRFIFCDNPLFRKIRRITRFIFCDYPLSRKIRRITRSPSAHFPHSKKLARIIRLIWFRPSPAERENKTSPGRPRLVCSNARTKR